MNHISGHGMGTIGGIPVQGDAYGVEVLADSPVMWLRFNDGPRFDDGVTGESRVNGQIVTDLTGRRSPTLGSSYGTYDGNTLLGQPPATGAGWSVSLSNRVCVFDESLGSADWYPLTTGEFTAEIWVKAEVPPLTGATLLGSVGWEIVGTATGVIVNAMSDQATETIDLNDGDWHHLVTTIDNGTEIKLYIDGTLRDTTSIGSLSFPDDQYLAIGESGALISASFDEAAIYQTVLSGTRIAAHYAAATS